MQDEKKDTIPATAYEMAVASAGPIRKSRGIEGGSVAVAAMIAKAAPSAR
jgi:hypothetical protein